MNNWKGYGLQQYIKNECPHYGNGDLRLTSGRAGQQSTPRQSPLTGPKANYTAGLFPVTANVMFGMMTSATPDGRSAGVPLADGISQFSRWIKAAHSSCQVCCRH